MTARNGIAQDQNISTKDNNGTKIESNFRINIKSESKVTSSIKNLRKINNQKHLDAMYLEDKLKSLQKQVDEFKSRSNKSNSTSNISGKSEQELDSNRKKKENNNIINLSNNNNEQIQDVGDSNVDLK